jgi:hypothetical protein
MGRIFLKRLEQLASRLLTSKAKFHAEIRGRTLRCEPLEERRLLAMFVSNGVPEGAIMAYDANSNAFIRNFATIQGSGTNYYAGGFTFGPNGNLYATTSYGGTVEEFNGSTGAIINTTFANGGAGTQFNEAIAFGPDGNLYVGFNCQNSHGMPAGCGVSEYNGTTGAYMGNFIQDTNITNDNSIHPTSLAFGPDGNLYVASTGTSEIYCFYGPHNANSGNLDSSNSFAVAPAAGVTVANLGGLTFGSNGNLYVACGDVATSSNGCVEEYTTGGHAVATFVAQGSGGLKCPAGLAFDPQTGNLYVCNNTDASSNKTIVNEYNSSGQFVATVIPSNANGSYQFVSIAFQNVVPVANSTTQTAPSNLPVNVNLATLASDFETPEADLAFAAGTGAHAPSNGSISINGNTATVSPGATGGQANVWYSVTDQADGGPANTVYGEITVNFPTSTMTFAAGSGIGTYGGTTSATVTVTCDGAPISGGLVSFFLDGGGLYVAQAVTNSSGVATLGNISLAGYNAGVLPSDLVAEYSNIGNTAYPDCSAATNLYINQAPLIVTAVDKSMVYGAAMPTFTASYTGLVNGDTSASLTTQPTFHTPATAASHVLGSPYTISVGGAVDPNYSFSYVPGTLTVTPAPLTITANNQSKVYGAALPALTASYTGFVNGDTSASLTTQPTLSTTATAASHVSGSPYSVTAHGAADADYSISYVAGTLTVTTAPLTITAVNKSKVYGAALPTLTASYTGFVNGDMSANLTTQPTLSTTATAASHVSGSPYSVTAHGAADADYSISYVAGTLTVTTAPLTITAVNKTKVYGAALPTLTASYTGFVNGDTSASLTTQPTLSTTATAASHVSGNPYSIAAHGAADADYSISYVAGTLTVTTAPLTVTAVNKTKVYGAALPTLTASYAGFVNGDTSANLTTQPTLSTTATAASHVSGNPYSITAHGAADADYSISYVAGTLTVTTAPLTITAVNKSKVYGAALPALTASYTGFVNGDTSASLTTQPTLSTTATAASHVSGNPYSITAHGAADADYSIRYVAGTLTVTTAPLTITANDKIMVTGNPLPTLTASYTGLVNGDTPASLTHAPVLSTTATSESLCGQYPINISGAASTDYTITQKPGHLWIITANGQAIWVPIDPLNPTKSLLIVSGTSANDVIQINPGAAAGSVTVLFDGNSLGTFSPTSRICVYGGGGTDTIGVSQSVTIPTWIYAEDGNVQMQGGGGPTLLMGGTGKDTLWGGSGRTIMIGGSGASTLVGGTGDAVLIGGTTAYDNNALALQALLSTWSSSGSYATRVGELTSDPTYPLNANTVFGDNVVDALFGGSGTDFFFQSPSDNLQNTRSGETVIAVS